jgi:hypothetical protein
LGSACAFNESTHWLAHQLESIIIPLFGFSHSLCPIRTITGNPGCIDTFAELAKVHHHRRLDYTKIGFWNSAVPEPFSCTMPLIE